MSLREALDVVISKSPDKAKLKQLADAYFEACNAAAIWQNAFERVCESQRQKQETGV